jgi:p-aminobenzoyl-glutamate transporter AbgT
MNRLSFNIGSAYGSRYGQSSGIGTLVSVILSNAVAIAGVILLFLFVMGGIGIISGAGQNNPEKVARGKKALTSAIIGFIIVFTVYWIILIIEQIFGFSILNPSIT